MAVLFVLPLMSAPEPLLLAHVKLSRRALYFIFDAGGGSGGRLGSAQQSAAVHERYMKWVRPESY